MSNMCLRVYRSLLSQLHELQMLVGEVPSKMVRLASSQSTTCLMVSFQLFTPIGVRGRNTIYFDPAYTWCFLLLLFYLHCYRWKQKLSNWRSNFCACENSHWKRKKKWLNIQIRYILNYFFYRNNQHQPSYCRYLETATLLLALRDFRTFSRFHTIFINKCDPAQWNEKWDFYVIR